ncbi:PAS domain S-box protein [Rubrobacter marinus]|uniref:PAS domain S-box protein n=1 Tax=Rubrobacter marinus TaxID=2653852 RepID=UPI00224BA9F3|nr:PAS domain S-box protein [Rubrobacter marinus]
MVLRAVGERERIGGSPAGEEAFRALVHGAPDLVAVTDAEGVLGYVSPSVERMYGHKPEEVVGRNLLEFVHPEDHPAALKDLAWTARNPGVVGMPGPLVRLGHRDGTWRHVETSASNLLDEPGVRGLVFHGRDITDRVRLEEELRGSEERFKALVENAQDFVVLADENNVALYASPAIGQILGYSPQEFVGTRISGYVHPDDCEWALGKVAEVLPVPGSHNLGTARYRHEDGSYRYLEVVVNNKLEDPVLRGVVCNCRDVTARVEAERALRASEERHRALNENALDFVVVQRADNTLSYVSPSIERLLGYKPEEAVGKVGADFIHPEDLEWAWPLFYEQLEKPGINEGVVIRYRHKDGSWRWFESACNNQLANPAVRGLVFNCRDVTARVEAETRLREAEERYRRLVERVPAATYIERNDAESSTVYVSPQIEEMLGHTPEEWISDPGLWLRTLHPEDHGRVLARHLKCNGTGEPFEEEYRCIARDGREVWVRDEAVLLRDERGEPLYWQGVKIDITARKKAELEILRLNTKLRSQVAGFTSELKAALAGLEESERYLEEREAHFQDTFELAAVGMAHVALDGRWVRVNKKLCEIVGYEREDLTKKTFQDVTHPEDLEADLEQVEKLLAGGIPSYAMEKRYVKGDGSTVWVEISVSLARKPSGEPDYFISVIEDIDQRKGAEALLKLLSAREVEILGLMAKGRTNTEIAGDLGFSPNTVKTHVKSITAKLGVSDRTQAAVYAAGVGLFTPRFRVPTGLPGMGA